MAERIPADEPIPVILARNLTAAANAPIGRPAVAVIPQYSDWNDFGHHLSATLCVFPLNGTATYLSIHFMFQGAPRTDLQIPLALGALEWIDITQVDTLFCSILDEVQSYEAIAIFFNDCEPSGRARCAYQRFGGLLA